MDVLFFGQHRGVIHIFIEHQGLRIRIGKGRDLVFQSFCENVCRRQVVYLGCFRLCLRDIPVLAIQAAQVASAGGQRKDGSAGQKMIQRFFLNGIHMDCAGITVSKRVQLACVRSPGAAKPAIAFGKNTTMWAKRAVHA